MSSLPTMDKLQLTKWARQESEKLAPTWPPGSKKEKDLVRYWETNRPQMVKALGAAIPALAHVLVHKALEAETRYLEAGSTLPDAREQASKEWLLHEPEEDPDEGSSSQPALGQTIT